MKGRFCWFVIMMSWVSVTNTRPFAPDDGPPAAVHHHQGIHHSPQSLQVTMSSKEGEMMEAAAVAAYKGVNKIGSSPPNCEHKCYGCTPCEATQVPTTSSHVGVQYTNYEPEGWKCKCGPTFYSP